MSKPIKKSKSVPKSKAAKKRREIAAALGASEAEQAAAEAALEQEAEEAAIASVAKLPPIPPAIEWVPPLGPPEIPSVWRDGGYLALVTGFHSGMVTFVSSSSRGETSRLELPRFWKRVRPMFVSTDPLRCILSFLARERSGIFNMRVRDIRRLLEMVTKETLQKMSERDLATEYRNLVDPKGPQRVKSDKKDEYIEKIMAAAKALGAKVESEEGAGKPPKKAKAPKEPKPPKEKKAKAPKEPKPPKEKKAKTPKEPKPPKKSAKEINASGGNPFREGSMKHKAFAVFVSTNGDRTKTVEAAIKAGSTPSTASSWYAAFTKL